MLSEDIKQLQRLAIVLEGRGWSFGVHFHPTAFQLVAIRGLLQISLSTPYHELDLIRGGMLTICGRFNAQVCEAELNMAKERHERIRRMHDAY